MLHYIPKCRVKILAIKCKPLIIELEIWEKFHYKNIEPYFANTNDWRFVLQMTTRHIGHQYWSGHQLKGTVGSFTTQMEYLDTHAFAWKKLLCI